jgi:hypothetical protein
VLGAGTELLLTAGFAHATAMTNAVITRTFVTLRQALYILQCVIALLCDTRANWRHINASTSFFVRPNIARLQGATLCLLALKDDVRMPHAVYT